MATELTMPQMGYDMQEGTIVRWLKPEGAEVQMGEAIAEIETDKAVVEFESYAEGLLQKILVTVHYWIRIKDISHDQHLIMTYVLYPYPIMYGHRFSL